MKKIFSLLFAVAFFWSGELLAQTEPETETEASEQTVSQAEIKDKGDKKKIKAEQRGSSNVYGTEAKPASPYAAC